MIWTDLDAAAPALALGADWLSPAERTRLQRFATPELRARGMAARVFLRAVLARVTRRAPPALCLRLGPRGKPMLEAGPQFNLTHSGGLAMIALHPGLPVGVDLEQAGRGAAPAGLARVLAPAEAAAPPRSEAEWLRLWVRKEALIKAQGAGLHADLTRLAPGHAPRGGWHAVPGTGEVVHDGTLPGPAGGAHPWAVALSAPRAPAAPPALERCDIGALIELCAAL